MRLSNFGAVRLPLLAAAVLALFACPVSAQIVERSQTWDNLIATHPCNAGLNGRHTILTDAQSSSSIGGGGGSVRVFVECDGVDTWSIVSIGGGAAGIGGTLGASDNVVPRSDGTGAATLQASGMSIGDAASNLIPVTASTGNAFQFTGSTNFPLRVLGNAGSVSILGAYDATIAGLWLGEPSPTQSNYSVSSEGTALYLNAPSASGEIDFFQDNTRQTATLLPAGLTLSGWTKAKVFVQENTGGVGSPDTINAGTSSGVFTNFGATAKNYNALPTALVGLTFTFSVQDSDGMRITAAAGDTIRQGASVTTTGGYIESTTVGSSVTLTAINADEWFVTATSDLGTNSWSFN